MTNSVRKGWFGRRFLLMGAAAAAVLGPAVSAVAAEYYHFKGEDAAAMLGANYSDLRTFSACAWVRNMKVPPEKYAVILSPRAAGGMCRGVSGLRGESGRAEAGIAGADGVI